MNEHQRPAPSAEDLARSDARDKELRELAKTMTEEERLAWCAQWHTKRRHVHVTDADGKKHEHHIHPHGITHMVREQGPNCELRWSQCASAEIAATVLKNATLSADEHLKIAQEHRDAIHTSEHPQGALNIAETHERLAKEAPGKTAEIMEVKDKVESQ